MTTRTDQELLREYAESGSEAAFSEVVQRYVDFVYSAALRLVRDPHLAQDVSQKVFLALAQNARPLSVAGVLPGWLHRAARNLSANAVRTEVRRRVREQKAAVMNEASAGEPAPAWETLAPHLDAALDELNESDRHALLLRYFQGKSAREMAESLDISSPAAQKRVNRAVERLRSLIAKRGITVGISGLTMLITANALQSAPADSAGAISSAVFSAKVFKAGTIATSKIIVMTTFQKLAIATVVCAVIGFTVQQARKNASFHKQAQPPSQAQLATPAVTEAKAAATETEISPFWRHRPSSPSNRARPAKSAAMPFPSTKMYALLRSKAPKLTLAQVKKYLDSHDRNSTSLLAAYHTTGDPALLSEARQKYPDDPQAAFAAAIRKEATPEEQRRCLDALKQGAPDNSLADYLSGVAYLKAGDTANAVRDLKAAAGKPQFEDYAQDWTKNDEEAYLAAGYPPGEAKLLANFFLASPQVLQVKEAGQSLVNLASQYQRSGDPASQSASLEMAADLGKRFDDPATGATLASQLIGITIERNALNAMDPTASYGLPGQTVQDRLAQLAEQKEGIHVLTAQADPLWQNLSDQDWLAYYGQLAQSSEGPALRWLVTTYGN